jgi:hypothetical protein
VVSTRLSPRFNCHARTLPNFPRTVEFRILFLSSPPFQRSTEYFLGLSGGFVSVVALVFFGR